MFRRNASKPTQLQVLDHLRECPGCGFFQRLPKLSAGTLARCVRCECRLERTNTNTGIFAPMALAVSSAVLYILAVTQTLLTFDVYGRTRAMSLFSGPLILVQEGWEPVSVLVVLGTLVFPAVVIALTLIITFSVWRGRISAATAMQLRWYDRLRPWSMAEVYILGVMVAYSKLIDLARVEIGYAVYAIVGLMITMASTDATLRIERIWQRKPVVGLARPKPGEADPAAWKMVGCGACGLVCSAEFVNERDTSLGPCPRCGEVLRQRKPNSLRRTLALLMAAIVLYIPANLFPIMTVIQLYRGGGHTILGGVYELYESGMFPLALLVFFASITVPVLKILSLGLMILGTWRGSAYRLVDRSKLYWLVDFIGRWSMIDVFMVSILVGLVQFGALGNVTANAGVEAFAAVVVLTIFAANAFDPRLMWDAAGLNGPRFAQRPRTALQHGAERHATGARV